MNKLLFILILSVGLALTGYSQEKAKTAWKYAVSAEAGNRNAGVGFQYGFQNRWFIPLSVGISNEFNEKKWNDMYVSLQPYYLFGKRGVQFPVGLLGGVRFMNDYNHHFPAFFCGVYGGALYKLGRHAIGLNVGFKYGKKHHLLEQSETWGSVSAYETYRERPLFFTVRYQIGF